MSLRDDLIEAGAEIIASHEPDYAETLAERYLDAMLDLLTERCRVVDTTDVYQREIWLGNPEDQDEWLLVRLAEVLQPGSQT